jgi:lipid-binding SYLF domain-containing protein
MTLRLPQLSALLLLSLLIASPAAHAKSAREIDASVDTALTLFNEKVYGGKELLAKAKGVLVMSVLKAGIGIGGEYGTGALRINGKTVDYYNTVGASVGFQLGGQSKKVFLLFMEDNALRNFRQSEGWKAGVDGSVALITIGADGAIDTTATNEPIVALVLGQKGLMYNLTIEGTKFNKIKPD